MERFEFLAELLAGDLGDDGVDGEDSSSFLVGALSITFTLSLSISLLSVEGSGVVVSAMISRCSRTDQISCGVVILMEYGFSRFCFLLYDKGLRNYLLTISFLVLLLY